MMLAMSVGAALVLAAASLGPDPEIITETMLDFERQDATPAEFREVKLGLYTYRPGDRRPILCGQFRSQAPDSNWQYFASIDTHGYEHWIGTHAVTLCQGESVALDMDDWAPKMNARLLVR